MSQIADIIKYEGDNSTFVWKHPCEDFNSLTQLIVHESQEAIFMMNGQALDLFGPGRYTLETQNIPKIGKFLNRATGDTTPFHCEVYFVNKTVQMGIKWGTDSKIQYIEPTYGFPISIGASGEMSLRAEDSRKLLLKLVGTESGLGQQQLAGYFRAFLMTRVKTYIAQVIKADSVNIFEIDEHLAAFSEALHKLLIPDFADYGVALDRFFVTTVVKPDGERQYEKFKELHFRQYADIAEAKLRQQTDLIYAQTEAQKVVIDSQAQATKRAQEGYTYAQERGFDVAEKVAQNEAVGQYGGRAWHHGGCRRRGRRYGRRRGQRRDACGGTARKGGTSRACRRYGGVQGKGGEAHRDEGGRAALRGGIQRYEGKAACQPAVTEVHHEKRIQVLRSRVGAAVCAVQSACVCSPALRRRI